MTEAEWMMASDPAIMLEFLQGNASDRRLRLFDVACCRSVWHLMADERSRNAVLVAEQFADRVASLEQLTAAWAMAAAAAKSAMTTARQEKGEEKLAAEKAARAAWEATWCAKRTPVFVMKEGGEIARKAWPKQAAFFHDIFGNPYRPVTLNPRWQTPAVIDLAQAIYDQRAFDRMPVLADALMEACCDDEEIIAHCRTKVEHVRGCWVVDLLLGKE